jgi:hypothetical protein
LLLAYGPLWMVLRVCESGSFSPFSHLLQPTSPDFVSCQVVFGTRRPFDHISGTTKRWLDLNPDLWRCDLVHVTLLLYFPYFSPFFFQTFLTGHGSLLSQPRTDNCTG